MSDYTFDWGRQVRTGIAEAVLCEPKTPAQIADIVDQALGRRARLLLTRLTPEQHDALPATLREALDFDPLSRTAILGGPHPDSPADGALIVAAGTADLGPAREAARTLAFHGYAGPLIGDVGVAGLWRLNEQIGRLREARVLIVVAGMEGALFSVVSGLVAAPVIALPTSVGYGVAAGGTVSLHAALSSCAAGVLVVNIDNGFGAAAAAIKILRTAPASR
ncbi:MAG TPA: nickel pincer cofactor biosynthesis protein LarB [Acetobacteraceae bacterium]|nr:nickel pincer cofactor biosynthesis protein LarB [Acetobacteraceae bacterium]